jgi:hypothetical protein
VTARRASALVLVCLVIGACARPAPEQPRVVYAPTPCLAAVDTPPAAPRPEAIAGPEQGCSAPEGCVTPELYLWVAASLRWMRGTWTKCGPPATTPAQTDGGER